MSVAERDPVEVAWLLSLFSGELAFDIGGNVGEIATQLSTQFSRVVSCEPAIESAGTLAAVARANPAIVSRQQAVSAHDGVVALSVNEHYLAQGQLTSGPGSDYRVVPCVTLDALAEEYGPPDFVKVDVEGHECHVVLGGLRTLVDHEPSLYVEVHNRDLGWCLDHLLRPIYGDKLVTVRHPGYPPGSWGHENHYYLVAKR